MLNVKIRKYFLHTIAVFYILFSGAYPLCAIPPKTIVRHPVSYNDEPIFYIAGSNKESIKSRAKNASKKMHDALNSVFLNLDEQNTPKFTTTLKSGLVLLALDGQEIMRLKIADARAMGFKNLHPLKSFVENRANEFLEEKISYLKLRSLILGIIVAILLLVATILTLKKSTVIFRKLEWHFLEKNYDSKNIVFLGIPLVSGETIAALISFLVILARIIFYFLVVIISLSIGAQQFVFSKKIAHTVFLECQKGIALAHTLLLESLPRITISIFIFAIIGSLIKIISAQLDGIGKKKFYRTISENKVPVLKRALPFCIFMAGTPVALATLLGPYYSSINHIFVLMLAAVIIAGIPLLVGWIVGAVIVWREDLKIGDWIKIGKYSGEICAINLHHIRIIPENGGTVLLPAMYTLMHPIYRFCDLPKTALTIAIKKTKPLDEHLLEIKTIINSVHSDGEITLKNVTKNGLYVVISTPWIHKNIQHDLLLAIGHAAESGIICLL